jgi:WD40 repeat protein
MAEIPGSSGRFRTLAGHRGRVTGTGLLTMPDGNPAIVSGSEDGTIRIWDVNTGYSPPQGETPAFSVRAFDALQLPDGRILGATAEDAVQDENRSRIQFWDFTDGHPFTEVSLQERVSALTCLPLKDGISAVIAYGTDYIMRAWDLTTGSALFENGADPDSWARTIAGCQLPEGESLLVTSGHNSAAAALCDASTGHLKKWLRRHTGWVSCAACGSYQGQPVAVTGGYDCRICVWGLPSGELRRSFRALDWSRIFPVLCRVESIALCEIGDHLPAVITQDQETRIRIWDVRNGRHLATITGATISTLHFDCLPVSRDRALVVTADADACMRVWLLSSQHRQRQDPACEVRLLDRIDIESRILGLRLNPDLTVVLNTGLGLAAIHLDLDVLLAGSGQDHPPARQRAARRPATPAPSA